MATSISSSYGYDASKLSKTQQSSFLNEKLSQVKDEQGCLGNIWNGIKEITNLGQSVSDCESMLEKFNSGEVSFEEAVRYIDSFDNKQENMSGLLSNVLTGIGAIASTILTVGTGPIGWGLALLKGAPIGAALKAGINLLDRATNNIEGDEFDVKEMAKDAISGAMTGATSAVSSGIGAGIKAGKAGISILNGAKCGAICGAASGAGSYMTDVAFGDKEFDGSELISNTVTSAFVSGTVGAAVGGGMYGIANATGNIGKEVTKSTTQAIIADSTSSTTRKILGQAEKNVLFS